MIIKRLEAIEDVRWVRYSVLWYRLPVQEDDGALSAVIIGASGSCVS
ncbi:MAG: hypothetical protein ACLVB3_09500 [Clostridium sp.]